MEGARRLRLHGRFSIQEQLLRRNVKRFRGGLVFKAHRLVYHSTLGLSVIKKKIKKEGERRLRLHGRHAKSQQLTFEAREKSTFLKGVNFHEREKRRKSTRKPQASRRGGGRLAWRARMERLVATTLQKCEVVPRRARI